MNDLNLLLREVTSTPPADSIDVDALIHTGRSRVRRRRLAGLAGTAAAVALLAALPVALSGPGEQPQPLAPGGEALALADAARAVEDRDYEVLQRFPASGTDEGLRGDFVRGAFPDGTLVVQRYDGPLEDKGSVRLVTSAGTTPSETVAPPGLGNYLGSTDRAAVFGSDTGKDLWLLDRTGGGWERRDARTHNLDLNTPADPQHADGGAFVLGGAPTMGAARLAVLELDLTRTGPARTLGHGGLAATAGDLVAWTSSRDRAAATVTLLDRASGSRSSFAPGSPCLPKELALTPSRVVLMVNCADDPDDQDFTDVVDQVLVFDHDGKALTSIRADQLGPVRVTDRFVTLTSWRGTEAGTYTYELATDRLLKVADGASDLSGDETGSGDVLVWQVPKGPGRGEYVVARMH